MTEQFVDPAISELKFDREIESFRKAEAQQRSRGIFLLEATFPVAVFLVAAAQLRPSPIVFGVRMDFSNYDIQPPSVRLINPFTGLPYKMKELLTKLPRRLEASNVSSNGLPPMQNLMQAHSEDEIPFLCLPGVLEYHTHPAHTGDSWFLHRGQGEGTLGFILDQLHKYGISGLNSYLIPVVNINAVSTHLGYDINRIPV